MASTKLAFLTIAVLLLQALRCTVAQEARNTAVMKSNDRPDIGGAVMSLTSFEEDPASCDGKLHKNGEPVVAMSSPDWFNGGSMCLKHIYILNWPNSHESDMVLVEVVDECNTQRGCKANTIAATKHVWDVLKLDTSLGEVNVNWTFAY